MHGWQHAWVNNSGGEATRVAEDLLMHKVSLSYNGRQVELVLPEREKRSSTKSKEWLKSLN